jgi:hypothetical protein
MLLVLACVARLMWLDADPYFNDWIGYITDEGRWTATARSMALYGEPANYGMARLHLTLAPVFQGITWLTFKLLGVGLWTARLFVALCGAGLLIALLTLRSHVAGWPWLLGVAVLGFDNTLLNLSRVALPEVPALFFTLLSFLVLALRGDRRWSTPVAGVLFLLAVGMKTTNVLMFPALVAVASLAPAAMPPRRRLIRAATLVGVAAAPAVVLLLASMGRLQTHDLTASLQRLSDYLRPGSLHLLIGRWFQVEHSGVNALLFGAWLASWAWLLRDQWRGSTLGRLYELSLVWAGGWLLAWGWLAYLPPRYNVHLMMPLVLSVMSGLTLLGRANTATLRLRLARGRRPLRALKALWLALPAALMSAPLAASMLVPLGVEIDRLIVQLLAVAACWGVLVLPAVSAIRGEASGRMAAWLILWPLMVVLAWQLALASGVDLRVWPVHSATDAPLHLLLVAGAALVAGWLSGFAVSETGMRLAGSVTAMIVAAALFVQQLPPYLRPTHIVRDNSRGLMAVVGSEGGPVQVNKAGSLFLENTLRFQDETLPTTVIPSAVVQFVPDLATVKLPGPEYELRLRFDVPSHPAYRSRAGGRAMEVRVYVRPQ